MRMRPQTKAEHWFPLLLYAVGLVGGLATDRMLGRLFPGYSRDILFGVAILFLLVVLGLYWRANCKGKTMEQDQARRSEGSVRPSQEGTTTQEQG